MEIRFLGNRLGHGANFDGALFDPQFCSPTILARDYKGAKEVIEIRKVDIVRDGNTILEQSRAEQLNGCVRLGNVYDDEKYTGGNFGGNVWDVNGLAPTMKTGASASQQCTVEVKKMETISIAIDEQNGTVRTDTVGTLTTDGSSPKHNNRIGEVVKIKIRQATKEGFVECEVPGICDLNYTSSKTRRGRVVEGGVRKSSSDNGEHP